MTTMKHILITGCSNGSVGSALAKSFSTHPNLHIFATSRSITSMSNLSSYPNITLLSLDVTSPTSISNALSTVSSTAGGRLDYLLNYAGCGYTMPVLDADLDTCKNMFEVNVWGAMRVTQAFAPLLIEARGMVVFAGSTAECIGVPFQGPYCGSKAALRLISESLRAELKPMGVKVLWITTGNITSNWFNNVPAFELPATSMYKSIEQQIETRAKGQQDVPWMKAEIYADKVVGDILAGKEGRVWRGETASLVKWAVAWLPGWLMDWEVLRMSGLNLLHRSGEESK